METQNNPHEREKGEPTEGDKSIPWPMMLTVAVLTLWGAGYLFGGVEQAINAGVGNGREPASVEVPAVDKLQPASPAPVAAIQAHTASEATDSQPSIAGSITAGEAIYLSTCSGCHQAGGGGLPGVFPPLLNSEWVLGQPRTLAAIVIGGYTGSMTVDGVLYQGSMPPFGSQLDDVALADLLSYLRSGMNAVDGVDTGLIAEVRSQLPGTPFSEQSTLMDF